MTLAEASLLLDITTDSVLNGFTRGKAQDYAEQLMKDLDFHVQEGERYVESCNKTFPRVHRCGDCGYFYQQQDCDSLCPNCMVGRR